MLTNILPNRFMIIGLTDTRIDKEKMIADFEETELLVKTYGGKVYAAAVQNKARGDYETYIGRGKAEEISSIVGKEEIDVVVVNDVIKSGQLNNLRLLFAKTNPAIRVWDRVDLILEIFSMHASTAEAKLQIKLAAMRHMGARIYGMGMELSQQGGGIGTRGIGETNTELMQRHHREEIRDVKVKLEKIMQSREKQMERRKKSGLLTVSLVGYTNSGKTTLFNALGRQTKVVGDALFVTLDSSVCKVYLPHSKKEIYLTDTIGFIQNLPPQLIEAFKSTLMEVVNADILLHIIDASDPFMHNKIENVELILRDLKIDQKKKIYVFNKMDAAKRMQKDKVISTYGTYSPLFISAYKREGLEMLLGAIESLL